MHDFGLFHQTNILIVDDDATMCLLMEESLSNDAYNISIANDGAEALSHIQNHRPDLVLLDVTMPGMNGFKVCEEIRRLYGDTSISIVMVTALEDAVSVKKSFEYGATDFINKPIIWETFPYRIQYLLKARNAIIEMQQQQSHLEYMEHISRIITQNKTKDEIVHETMYAMLNILLADTAILLKPDESQKDCYVADCEINNGNTPHTFISEAESLEKNVLYRASKSEYPIITHYGASNLPPQSNPTLTQQMISSLHVNESEDWYLILQQHSDHLDWTATEEETFYKINLRLTTIISRHLLTRELGQSEALLKHTQKISHLGNWHWNAINKEFTWSDELYQIYARTTSNYTPNLEKYYEVEFEEDHNRLILFYEIQNKKIKSYQINHRILLPNKKIKWIHEQCVAIYNEYGNLLGINGIAQDVTATYLKKEQEIHNNKMESIGQLTSGIAHDFGNLMTVAKGNIEFLEEIILNEDTVNQESKELIEDTHSAVNDSIQLTKQLLFFSRKKSIDPIYVDINQKINKFESLIKQTLGDNITISINVADKLENILVDPVQFESAIINILINARNAMPEGGEISIVAKKVNRAHSHEVIRNADHDLEDECICISIHDTGIGMDESVQKRAIEPFFTTQKNTGTGLGLSMVYGFIKQSGGELIIKSKLQVGTTISLQLPIYGGHVTDSTVTETKNTLDNINATILVVEDRQAVKQFAIRCLKNTGMKILHADNAVSARELLNTNKVDILFSDIIMPGDMNGHQLAKWATTEYNNLKVLLTTAMEADALDEIKADLNDKSKNNQTLNQEFTILAKPYSKNDLIGNIISLLNPIIH